MTSPISGQTQVAGVVGAPVIHSLSPLIHNAWLRAANIDAIYVAFPVTDGGFSRFVLGARGGVLRGLNVTAPFKEAALDLADSASPSAKTAGAANLLIFARDGQICADNTDGAGLMQAFALQAPGFEATTGPVAILGAGGAGRGAVAAFLAAGAPAVHLINRSRPRAEAVADRFGSRVKVFDLADWERGLVGVIAVINATTQGMGGQTPLALDFRAAPDHAVAMDMVYRPLQTAFLQRAAARGLVTVDGLGMLIGQAAPTFKALFGQEPPDLDVRSLCLKYLQALA